MATGDKRVNIFRNRLLDRTGLRDNFLAFLVNKIEETVSAVFTGQSGTLDTNKVQIVAGSGSDEFSLSVASASKGVVGGGQVITLPGSTSLSDIPFPNATGSVYEIGIKFASVADGLDVNSKTGLPEYPAYREDIGEQGTPDSVTDNPGVSITLNINTLLGGGQNYNLRDAVIYLATPQGHTKALAFADAVISHSASNNTITIFYSGSDGPLGQDTSVLPPSTTAADYVVFVPGPSVKVGAASVQGDADYWFIGEITGNGTGAIPSVFDMANQDAVFLATLDRAYDGSAGSGSGRIISLDAGAVELLSRIGMTDTHGAAFRVDRKSDLFDGGVCAELIMDEDEGAAALHLRPLTHTTGNLIADNPVTSSNPDILTRTGSVDWSTSNVNPRCDMAMLQGFATLDGLYRITAVTATTLQVRTLDGSVPSLGVESGTVTVVRLVQSTASQRYGGTFNPLLHGYGGTSFAGNNAANAPISPGNGGDDSYAAAKFYGDQADQAHFYESDPSTPVIHSWIDKEGVLKTQAAIVVAPNPNITAVTDLGLVLDASRAPTNHSPNGKDLLAQVKNVRGDLALAIEPGGRVAHPHRFCDDFMYNETQWTNNATVPKQYAVGGTGGVALQSSAVNALSAGGHAILRAEAAADENVLLQGGRFWLIRPAVALINFFARAAFNYEASILNDREEYFGITDDSGPPAVYILFEHSYSTYGDNNWHVAVSDGTNTEDFDTGVAFVADDGSGNPVFRNFHFAMIGKQSLQYFITGMSAPATESFSSVDFDGLSAVCRMVAFEENNDVTLAETYLDFWECHDSEALVTNQGVQRYALP